MSATFGITHNKQAEDIKAMSVHELMRYTFRIYEEEDIYCCGYGDNKIELIALEDIESFK